MDDESFVMFEAVARARGFNEVLVREWAPGQVNDTHSHPFALQVRVVRGEMWLRRGDETLHVVPGGGFELDAGVPHAERYGAEGATFWVARRHAEPPGSS